MRALDPVTLAVLNGRLVQIADEMDATLFRSAFNPIIAEAHDACHGLYHAETGATLVQGTSGLPIFVGAMAFAVKAVIDKVREQGGLKEGDTYLFNDPYDGGTHLNDFRLVRPVMRKGKVFAWLASVGHWLDVGGNVPGNFNAKATESFQECCRMPPGKVSECGVFRQDIADILAANSRVPQSNWGELNGQLIVNQTVDNQTAVYNLLQQLRETRALQIAIESRLLLVSNHFLDVVGFSWNLGFQPGSALGGTGRGRRLEDERARAAVEVGVLDDAHPVDERQQRHVRRHGGAVEREGRRVRGGSDVDRLDRRDLALLGESLLVRRGGLADGQQPFAARPDVVDSRELRDAACADRSQWVGGLRHARLPWTRDKLRVHSTLSSGPAT